jgi:hypothetical protein
MKKQVLAFKGYLVLFPQRQLLCPVMETRRLTHRNETTHGYDEPLIEEISKNIPAYATLLSSILDRTKIKS